MFVYTVALFIFSHFFLHSFLKVTLSLVLFVKPGHAQNKSSAKFE